MFFALNSTLSTFWTMFFIQKKMKKHKMLLRRFIHFNCFAIEMDTIATSVSNEIWKNGTLVVNQHLRQLFVYDHR
jgi:ribosomal protein L31E